MAELTYDDVRRATQTVAQGLQSAINDIRSSVQGARGDINRLSPNDLQYRLMTMERVLTDLQQFAQRIDAMLQNLQPQASYLQQSGQAVQRLEQRIANLEQLNADICRHMNVLHESISRLHALHQQMFARPEP